MNDIKGLTIKENASLKNLNTYKIDSKAKYLIRVNTVNALIASSTFILLPAFSPNFTGEADAADWDTIK